MRHCALCGQPVDRLTVRVEFTHFAGTCGPDPAPSRHLTAHHDCGARAYAALFEWKLDPLSYPGAGPASLAPAKRCDVCASPANSAEGEGLLVQLFVERGQELVLAAEFGLGGHGACIETVFRRTATAKVEALAAGGRR